MNSPFKSFFRIDIFIRGQHFVNIEESFDLVNNSRGGVFYGILRSSKWNFNGHFFPYRWILLKSCYRFSYEIWISNFTYLLLFMNKNPWYKNKDKSCDNTLSEASTKVHFSLRYEFCKLSFQFSTAVEIHIMIFMITISSCSPIGISFRKN
jgi:hypothetical protein